MFVRERLMVGGVVLALALGTVPATAHEVNPTTDAQYNHLECYQVKDVKLLGVEYTFDLEAHATNFLPANTIGQTCRFKRSADQLCIDARTANMVPAPLADGDASEQGTIPNAWDYACYKVKCDRPSQPAAGTEVMIKDRFGQRTGVRVKRIRKLCVPLLKKGPASPSGAFLDLAGGLVD